jgi:hypothetical protein
MVGFSGCRARDVTFPVLRKLEFSCTFNIALQVQMVMVPELFQATEVNDEHENFLYGVHFDPSIVQQSAKT